MKQIPLMSETEELESIIKLSSRSDKLGNIVFFVTYGDNQADYAAFSHLSSALDFIVRILSQNSYGFGFD